MKKILLLGAAGQVGWQLRRSLAPLGEVTALQRDSRPLAADLAHPDTIVAAVRSVQPDVIVNAAAYTAVDRAETETDLAFAINAHACEVLAKEAAACDAWLVHYSTDYVFDGTGERAWTEDDATGPINVYGRSKLAGEQAIAAHCSKFLVFRTSWVFDTVGANFLKTILRVAAQRDALDVVADQCGAPTRAALIADVTAHALRGIGPQQAGIYHLAPSDETTWHAYAQFAIRLALDVGVQLAAAPERVRAIPSTQFPTPAQRPGNSRLDTSKLRRTFGLHLPPWQDGVAAVVRELAAHGAIGTRSE